MTGTAYEESVSKLGSDRRAGVAGWYSRAGRVTDRGRRAGEGLRRRSQADQRGRGSGNTDAVRTLLENGADPNLKETANGQTALMFAAASDRVDVVKLLMSRGADLHATSRAEDFAKLTMELVNGFVSFYAK